MLTLNAKAINDDGSLSGDIEDKSIVSTKQTTHPVVLRII